MTTFTYVCHCKATSVCNIILLVILMLSHLWYRYLFVTIHCKTFFV